MEKKRQADSPNTKSKRQMVTARSTLQRTLVFHNAVIAEMRDKYKNLQSDRDKQMISKIMAGKVLKKYRLLKMAEREFGFSPRRMRSNEKRTTALTYTRKKQKNSISPATEKKNQTVLRKR